MGDNQNNKFSLTTLADDGSSLRKVRVNILDPQTGEAIEEVDVLTSAESVTFSDNRTLPEELEYILKYSNLTPTTADIGGIKAGTIFDNVEIKDIITQLLHPYVAPQITLSSTSHNLYYEYGVNISPLSFTATVIKESNDISSVQLFKNGSLYNPFTISKDGGSASIVHNEVLSSNASFLAKVTDATNEVYETEPIRYIFNQPIYYGSVGAGTVTEGVIKALPGKFINFTEYNDIHLSDVFSPTNQSFFIAYRSYQGDLEKVIIRDQNGLDITKSFDKAKINILDKTNAIISYTYLKSNLTTQQSFKLDISIKN